MSCWVIQQYIIATVSYFQPDHKYLLSTLTTGTLQQSALQRPCAGIARNLDMLPVSAKMKRSATRATKEATWLMIALAQD